jgi:hypothetical protein
MAPAVAASVDFGAALTAGCALVAAVAGATGGRGGVAVLARVMGVVLTAGCGLAAAVAGATGCCGGVGVLARVTAVAWTGVGLTAGCGLVAAVADATCCCGAAGVLVRFACAAWLLSVGATSALLDRGCRHSPSSSDRTGTVGIPDRRRQRRFRDGLMQDTSLRICRYWICTCAECPDALRAQPEVPTTMRCESCCSPDVCTNRQAWPVLEQIGSGRRFSNPPLKASATPFNPWAF